MKEKKEVQRPEVPPEPPPTPTLTVTIDLTLWQRHDVEAKLRSAFGGIGITVG